MIEHSRVLTGSDDTFLYYNEPGNGTQNVPLQWSNHRAALMATLTSAKPEIIDTVVILTEPRTAEERRGVIWLLPETGNFHSSITLRDSFTGEDVCYWYWDGSGTRNGYYFDNQSATPNPCAEMPADPEFDHSFGIHLRNLELHFRLNIHNIDNENHEYLAAIEVIPNGTGTPIQILHAKTPTVYSHIYKLDALEATFPLDASLGSGRHVLRFTLWLDGILQDTKYVAFSIPAYTAPLPAMPTAEDYSSLPMATVTFPPPAVILPTPEPCILHSPLLRSPADGAWTVTSPLLEWDYLSFTCWPETYHLQVATDARFLTSIVDQVVSGTSYQVFRLQQCTKYYWRVAGILAEEQGPFSASRWFMPGDARQCP
jgi:hypothetical protein